jgi:soluble lytic murein transglycosylase
VLLGLTLLGSGAWASASSPSPQSRSRHKKSKKAKSLPCTAGCRTETSAPQLAAETPEGETLGKELAALARALHTAQPRAYENLAAFAGKNAQNVWGARAALALGYDDYSKNHPQQALMWLKKAEGDTLLREYVLYFSAETKRALKNPLGAYVDLQTIQHDYPNTAIREQFLEIFAPTAVETGHAAEAIDALSAYSATGTRPALLLERAHAYQAAHQLPRAAKDYQTVFYKYPLSDEAKSAGSSMAQVQRTLGKEYPYPGAEMQETRAQLLFDAHKWRDARLEFEKLVGMLHDPANPSRQRAELRVAQCRVQLKSSASLIARVNSASPEVEPERLFVLSQAWRNEKHEAEMLAAIDQLLAKFPDSKWADEGLMQAGNYFWVSLDRQRATGYYQRLLDSFPAGKNAFNAEWRIAWVAYLDRKPDAEDRMKAFLLRYPTSSNASDAIYWLGRNAERGGNPAHARSFYSKVVERFPQTYFGHAAGLRLAKLGSGEENPAQFLDQIPAPQPLKSYDEPIPESAGDRWARAQALRMIGFDNSAEQELKTGYFSTGSPRFLLEAAQAAFDQGHFGTGMSYARLIVPSAESRKIEDLPKNVWKALYPLPYEAALRREAARNNCDPMLAAGLIRQESTFQADAISRANAVGLMQVLPKTGKLLARQLKVHYAKTKLTDPEYNLQLGMLYISSLLRDNKEPEYALAAFNAGEDRIALWRSERQYEEVPELVESIPFSETREYVQVVLRNAEVYRLIYGASPAPATAPVSQGRLAVSASSAEVR